MAKKIKLEPANGEISALVGIATQLRDYQLVHFMNQILEIDLSNVDDLPVYNSKNDNFSYFTLYLYRHPDLRTDFCLVSNQNGSSPLIPSLRQISYFLFLQGSAYKNHTDNIIASVRKIKGIQAALPINPSTVREIGTLLEDLELHLLELNQKSLEN